MAGLSVGSLIAYLQVNGATEAAAQIGRVQSSMNLAAGSAAKLGGAVADSEAALSGAGRSANIAATGSDKLKVAQLSLVAATERYNAVLADENASLGKTATAQAALLRAEGRVAAATDTATASTRTNAAVMKESAASSETLGSKLGGVIATAGKLGIALGAFELIKKAIDITKEAGQFQRQMLQIQTVANAGSAEMKTMSKAVLDMAGSVATSPDQLAVSLYHVEQNGLRGATALDVVKTAAEGAKIGMADVEETTNSMTSAVASGISGVQNMDQAMGALLATVGTGDMKMSDLNEALGSGILSVAKTYGLSLKDVGASLAVFGDLNIRGADASSALRQAVMAFAKPAVTAKSLLDQMGMSTKTLAVDMQHGGLNQAVTDLRDHLNAAGITGDKVGQALLELFGKKAGVGVSILVDQYARLQTKYGELDAGAQSFGDKWNATTKTASFAFQQLGAEAQSAGIQLADNLLPALTTVAGGLGKALPAALSVAGDALKPFASAWDVIAPVLATVAHAIGDVSGHLGPALPVIKGVTAATLAMWVAFKGYQLARLAVQTIADAFSVMSTNAATGMASMGRSLAGGSAQVTLLASSTDRATGQITGALYGTAADATAASRIMQAEFAAIGQSALDAAAAEDRAAATEAEAYAAMVSASDDATATMIANSQNAALAASNQAKASEEAAVTSAAAAETAAADIDTAGAAASAGWKGVLGPIGLAAVAVLTVASMFHKSTTASKEATDAAKAYADAIKSGGKSDLIDSITTQLANNNVPEKVNDLNKALGSTRFAAKDFATAIQEGGGPLVALRAKLTDVMAASKKALDSSANSGQIKAGNAAAKEAATQYSRASELLKDLNTQSGQLSTTVIKDLADTKAFAGVSSSIDKVSQSTSVASGTAQTYAQMMGIAVDKNGVAAVSADTLAKAVATVSTAYDTASQTGDAFLSAMQTFSTSAGTSADRAALIGATLKANAGDALSFATNMNAAAVANHQLATDIVSNADTAAGATKNTKAINVAYLQSIVKLKDGTIDYSKAAAAPLISDLQSIQTSAINAATATYQHNLVTEGAKKAADDAVTGYTGVETSLEGQLVKLGLSAGAAQKLTEQYLGVPSHVKTLIEQEGADPVVTVLDKIGTQLSYLTGHPWATTIEAKTAQAMADAAAFKALLASIPSTVYVNYAAAMAGVPTKPAKAAGGKITGPGSGTSDDVPINASNGEYVSTAASTSRNEAALAAGNAGAKLIAVKNYAAGGKVGPITTSTSGGRTVWVFGGQRYTSARTAENAQAKAVAADRMLAAKVTGIDSVGVDKSLTGSAAAIASAMAKLMGDTTKLGAPKSLSNLLKTDNVKLQTEANARTVIAGKLATANQALVAAQKLVSGEKANIQSTVLGSFNITNAGQGPAGMTGAAILSQLQAAVGNAQKFNADIQGLQKQGLSKSLIQQLAEAGPSALPEAAALLASGRQTITAINANYSALNTAGAAVGGSVANQMYGAGVTQAKGVIAGFQSQEKQIAASITKLANTMGVQLRKVIQQEISHAFRQGAYQ